MKKVEYQDDIRLVDCSYFCVFPLFVLYDGMCYIYFIHPFFCIDKWI